jgi:hypothetical protein
MSKSNLTVEFEPLEGWGDQIGWAHVVVHDAVPGLRLNRFAVFQHPEADIIGIGMPTEPGKLPASAHVVVSFDTDRDPPRFIGRLLDALRAAHPELFDREAGR